MGGQTLEQFMATVGQERMPTARNWPGISIKAVGANAHSPEGI